MIRFRYAGDQNVYRDMPIRFDLNEEGDKINGIQLMTDVYSKEMINTILSVGLCFLRRLTTILNARECTADGSLIERQERITIGS